jgi:hypothetical protein
MSRNEQIDRAELAARNADSHASAARRLGWSEREIAAAQDKANQLMDAYVALVASK